MYGLYSEEQNKWLIEHRPYMLGRELTEEFNKTFNENRTMSGLTQYCYKKLGVKCLIDATFKKGHTPANKGKTWDEYMPKEAQERARKTCFNSQYEVNNQNSNKRPIGSERTDTDGYTLVKIADPKEGVVACRGQKGWVFKQRLLYEQYHNVTLTENDAIIFLDGNKQNFSIENLHRISRAENVRINQNHLRCDNAELTQLGIDIVRLQEQIRKGEKDNG